MTLKHIERYQTNSLVKYALEDVPMKTDLLIADLKLYARSKLSSKVSVPLIRKNDNSIYKDDYEAANTLAEYFMSVYTTEPDGIMPNIRAPRISDYLTFIDITENKVLKQLKCLKVDSSPGPDKLSPLL